ncbi:MAG: hypothetical protein OEY63_07060, partial [Gemmatimonadota bacterium]|nr:hypothetical protein [Gemmatimonadota bacterium]
DAATVERLFREVLKKSDRTRRDSAVLLNGDFSVSPSVVPELIRGIDSGADLVVAESNTLGGGPLSKLVAKFAPKLLSPGVRVPGVKDLLSGVAAIRLVTLKRCFGEKDGILLVTEGAVARAELLARAAAFARQIQTVPVPEHDRRPGSEDPHPLSMALHLFRAGRTLHIPQAPETVSQN